MDIKKSYLGVARYISDDPFDVPRMQRMETSFNLDGIWGGNMYANRPGQFFPTRSPPSTTSAMFRTWTAWIWRRRSARSWTTMDIRMSK